MKTQIHAFSAAYPRSVRGGSSLSSSLTQPSLSSICEHTNIFNFVFRPVIFKSILTYQDISTSKIWNSWDDLFVSLMSFNPHWIHKYVTSFKQIVIWSLKCLTLRTNLAFCLKIAFLFNELFQLLAHWIPMRKICKYTAKNVSVLQGFFYK